MILFKTKRRKNMKYHLIIIGLLVTSSVFAGSFFNPPRSIQEANTAHLSTSKELLQEVQSALRGRNFALAKQYLNMVQNRKDTQANTKKFINSALDLIKSAELARKGTEQDREINAAGRAVQGAFGTLQ